MSIAMERFGLSSQPESRESGGSPNPTFPYRMQCRACGFEPAAALIEPRRCPKCGGSSWERFAFPGSLLVSFERRAERNCDNRSQERPRFEPAYEIWSSLF